MTFRFSAIVTAYGVYSRFLRKARLRGEATWGKEYTIIRLFCPCEVVIPTKHSSDDVW